MSDYFGELFPKKPEELDQKEPDEWGRKMSVLAKNVVEIIAV